MKTNCRLWWALVVLAGAAADAGAQRSGTGVGAIVGDPTGVSVKHWVGPDRAIAGAAGWNVSGDDEIQFHVDYLLHNFEALRKDFNDRTALYYGVGARVHFEDDSGRGDDSDTGFGIRVPAGFDFFLAPAPLDVFIELAPVLELAPDTQLELNAAIGIRYFFE